MTFRSTQAVILGAVLLLAGCKMPGSTVSANINKLKDQVAQCEAEADALPAEPGEANAKLAADLYERVVQADNTLARYNRMGGAFTYADFDEMKALRPRVDALRSGVAAKLKAVAGGDAARLQKEIEAKNPPTGVPAPKK